MNPDEATWVRAHAWTPAMRRQPYFLPGTSTATYDQAAALALCECMVGVCWHCGTGRHEHCHRTRLRPRPEGFLRAPCPYNVSPVWLAGQACRSLCPCQHARPARYEIATLPGLELAGSRA